jgi:aryl-alcohol dehydrogenase-like predicted oxidoreductase
MRIPNTDLNLSSLGMGTAGLGTELKGDDSNRLLDTYLELGGNSVDSAHCYACWIPGGIGASERAVGEWLRKSGARGHVAVATKGGHPPIDGYPHPTEFLKPESLSEDVAQSLDRLGIDEIDLYYLHRDDGKTPVAEIIDALNGLKGTRYFGASNWSVERVAEANAYAEKEGKKGFVALQNQWSLAIPTWSPTEDPTVRYVSNSDANWCDANNLPIFAYSSTSNGYFSHDRDEGGFCGNVSRRERAVEMATTLGCTPTQVAIAWLLNQNAPVVPLLGTTKVDRLKEGFGAIGIKLDSKTRDWLRG